MSSTLERYSDIIDTMKVEVAKCLMKDPGPGINRKRIKLNFEYQGREENGLFIVELGFNSVKVEVQELKNGSVLFWINPKDMGVKRVEMVNISLGNLMSSLTSVEDRAAFIESVWGRRICDKLKDNLDVSCDVESLRLFEINFENGFYTDFFYQNYKTYRGGKGIKYSIDSETLLSIRYLRGYFCNYNKRIPLEDFIVRDITSLG